MPTSKQLYGKDYYQKHKATILANSKRNYMKNRDAILDRHTEYHRRYILTPNGRFSTSKETAKCRGYEWTISREEFATLAQQPCYYCRDIITRIKGSGLDRVDSNRGYTPDNVVTCCIKCNQSKSNLTQMEFYVHVLKMSSRIKELLEKNEVK